MPTNCQPRALKPQPAAEHLPGDVRHNRLLPHERPQRRSAPRANGGFDRILAVALTLAALLCPAPLSTAGIVGYAPDRVLLKLKPGVSEAEATALISSQSGLQVRSVPHIDVRVLKVPQTALARVLLNLSRHPKVQFAEPDALLQPDLVPNDPYFSSQWHLATIEAPKAWEVTTGNAGVIVAVLDTGVDASHPDLAANLVPGWNLYDNNANTADVYGHGTEVAGVVAALGNNGAGVASVAYNCALMPIRVTDTRGVASASTIASGLTWAADHGARVANISYEVTGMAAVSAAAQYFTSRGGVVTVSAGNEGTVLTIPDDPNLLTVSATDSNDALASWSNTGTPVDLAAPGVGIFTTTPGGGYAAVSGTSFAAPLAAGVAALAFSANLSLSSVQVQQILKQSADDLGAPGWDAGYGWGRLNAQKAVNLAVSFGQVPGWTNQICGRVLWAGQPVSGALVSTPNGTNLAQVLTAQDGTYVLSYLADATSYPVSCSKPGLTFTPQFTNPLPLNSGNAYGADFYADQPALLPFTVSGQVTDPVNGAAGVEVRGGGMITTTDASGHYQFTNFANGAYTLAASKDAWTFSPAPLRMEVNFADGMSNDFARVAPYSVSGVIYGVPAWFFDPAPVVHLSNGNSNVARLGFSGTSIYWVYTLTNVPAGQYSLSAELAGYNIVPTSFTLPLTVNSDLKSLNFTGSVATVAGSLRGRVTQQGVPLPGVTVQALQGASSAGTGVTDSEGYYQIPNLPDAAYTLVPAQAGYTFAPASLTVASTPGSGNDFSATGPNPPPLLMLLTAAPQVVSNSALTTTLSAQATGYGTLIYSWDAVSGPAPVSFSLNDSPSASSTTVAFQAPGTYVFRARVTDGDGLPATTNISVTVLAGAGPLVVVPYQFQLNVGQTVAYRADAWDQAGNRVSVSPVWSVNGGGTIDSTGLFTAGAPGGPYLITATAGTLSATGYVWVIESPDASIPPTIASQPLSQTLPVGADATFSVGADGTAPLSYQWLWNDTVIAGATGSSFTRTNVQPSDAGTYSVQVTNAAGTATSSNAVLTLIAPPVITLQPLPLALAAGADATFTVAADSTAPLGYQWSLNGASIAEATDRTYTRTNVQTVDAGTYSVQVSNAAGTTNSANALLTVNNPPRLAAVNNMTIHAGSLVRLTNSASDPDLPAQTLTFSLETGFPSGATIDPVTGVFEWPTTAAQAGTTNPITIRVSDNGTPALSAAATFDTTVLPPPACLSITADPGSVTISWSAIPGTIYRVQYQDRPGDSWSSLAPDVIADGPTASLTDSMATPLRFYRVLVVP